MHTTRKAYLKLIPCAVLAIGGAFVSIHLGNIRSLRFDHKLISAGAVIVFIIFSTLFLTTLTKTIRRVIISHRLGVGRAAALQFIIRAFGYAAIIIGTLDLLDVPVGRLLLGSAVLGIILGVAAQQALGNFFASIVLIISHPFAVGEKITLNSGAMGGKYVGTVIDIGLTHTHLREKNGDIVYLPNSTLLSAAAIRKTATAYSSATIQKANGQS
jgi:small-conductance mechanosensitive channel